MWTRALGVVGVTVALMGCAEIENRFNNCVPEYRAPDWNALTQQTAQAKALWQAQKPASYRYRYQDGSFAGFALEVEVQGGVVVTAPIEGSGLSPEERQRYTVDALFADLEARLSRRETCNTVQVRFEGQWGYPKQVSWSNQKQGLMDAYWGFGIHNFSEIAGAAVYPPHGQGARGAR